MEESRTLLTLEERLARAAGSQAASPEAAASLVQRLAGLPAGSIFYGSADLNAMHALTGMFWDHPLVDVDSYQGFCSSFQLAIAHDNAPTAEKGAPDAAMDERYQPTWGVRVCNAIVLLGLMLLDHAKGLLRPRSIYHCTRMTLGQYLDAAATVGPWKGEKPDGTWPERFQLWRDALLLDYDANSPLATALANILRRYIAAWQVFDHLDHVLRCAGALACYLEREGAGAAVRPFKEALCRYAPDLEGWELVEADKHYPDPQGYYFTLAWEYSDDMPDPGGAVLPRAVRSQVLLPRHSYSPHMLHTLIRTAPSDDLRALLEKCACPERLSAAMRQIDTAVADLYMLLVEPYRPGFDHRRRRRRPPLPDRLS